MFEADTQCLKYQYRRLIFLEFIQGYWVGMIYLERMRIVSNQLQILDYIPETKQIEEKSVTKKKDKQVTNMKDLVTAAAKLLAVAGYFVSEIILKPIKVVGLKNDLFSIHFWLFTTLISRTPGGKRPHKSAFSTGLKFCWC